MIAKNADARRGIAGGIESSWSVPRRPQPQNETEPNAVNDFEFDGRDNFGGSEAEAIESSSPVTARELRPTSVARTDDETKSKTMGGGYYSTPRLSEYSGRFGVTEPRAEKSEPRVESLAAAFDTETASTAAGVAPRMSAASCPRTASLTVDELFAVGERRAAVTDEIHRLHADGMSVSLRPNEVRWLQVLAEGWATPLTGFMRHAEFLGSLHFSATRGKAPGSVESQPLPIVLPCTAEDKDKLVEI